MGNGFVISIKYTLISPIHITVSYRYPGKGVINIIPGFHIGITSMVPAEQVNIVHQPCVDFPVPAVDLVGKPGQGLRGVDFIIAIGGILHRLHIRQFAGFYLLCNVLPGSCHCIRSYTFEPWDGK